MAFIPFYRIFLPGRPCRPVGRVPAVLQHIHSHRSCTFLGQRGLWLLPKPIAVEGALPASKFVSFHHIWLALFAATLVVPLADADGLPILDVDIDLDFFLRLHSGQSFSSDFRIGTSTVS